MFSLNVPIIDVHRENFKEFWQAIILAIKSSSFIALDVELSGLGCRKKLMAKSIEDRYQSIADVARTRSILSVGLSCFKYLDRDQDCRPNQETFLTQTFNITSLCNEDYTVEPGALKFLVEHGFDFNKQYSYGVPYYRGLDKKDDKEWPSVRLLFSRLLAAKKPLALHNGLVDLVFLYQNLYCELPPTSAQFIADLSEMYEGGILDSKYVAEYAARMHASYLEYVFKRSQRENAVRGMAGDKHVVVDFCQYPEQTTAVQYQNYALPPGFTQKTTQAAAGKEAVQICEHFAAHGCCSKGMDCPKSHDPDAILNAEEVIVEKKRKRRQRRRNRKNRNKETNRIEGEQDEKKHRVEDEEEDGMDTCDQSANDANDANGKNGNGDVPSDVHNGVHSEQLTSVEPPSDIEDKNGDAVPQPQFKTAVPKKTGVHRAGFDAFMTGFAVATFMTRFGSTASSDDGKEHKGESIVEHFRVGHLINKLYLSGKDYPLSIAKSSFTKTSTNHREKMIAVEKLTR